MREYKKIKIETEELTKILCDTCKKEIQKYASDKTAYIPSGVITVNRKYSAEGWGSDVLDFCSIECFLEWAKTETGAFTAYFPYGTLDKIHTEINNELQGGKVNGN